MKVFSCLLMQIVLFSACSTCSSSGRKHKANRTARRETRAITTNMGNNKVPMTKSEGVYLVPIEINGVPMEFIFDTGASDIIMSADEAIFLYRQGKLTHDDILGTQQYRISDGSITEGTVINLRQVKIGNKVLHNVQASIVHNLEAPLLLGQSALSKFGKVSIDYDRKEVSFE